MGVIQTPDYFGNAFAQAFNTGRLLSEREAERKRQEEQAAALGQLYLESMRAPGDAAVAPYQANAITGREKAFDAQVRSDASAMTDAIVATNPALMQRVAGTSAPVTPEMQAQFQQTNQANVAQSGAQAQGADQMLALAKEKYGTAMFDRLGPIVASGKVPPQAMIAIIEKQIQAAEKTAIKQATVNAVKILSDPKAAPEQKQAVLGQLMVDNPQAARGLADAFGLKQSQQGFTLGQGQTRYDSQGRPIASVAPKPEKPAAGTWLLQTNPDGSQVKVNTITGQEIKVSPAKETFIETPLGKFSNSQLLARLEAVRPKTIEIVDDFGKKITKREGDIEVYNILNKALKDHVAKQQPATTSQQSPTLQGIVDNIQKNKEAKTFDDAIKEIDKNQAALIAQGVDPEKLKIYTHQIYGVPLQ